MTLDAGGHSDVGGRRRNEDRWAIAADGSWAMVSDGVGGAAGGDVAAEISVAVASAALESGATAAAAVAAADRAVREEQARSEAAPSMAATLTIARQLAPGRWEVGAVGDSPAFVVGPGLSVHRLVRPHTLAEALVERGVISPSESSVHPGRHRVTRCVGHTNDADPDVVDFPLEHGSCILLASDGIDVLPDAALPRLTTRRSAAAAAASVVQAALSAGASDNVTAVVVRRST